MEKKLKENAIEFDADDFVAGDFIRFAKVFTERQLSSLRGVELSQPKDSTFLHMIVRMLYSDDLHRLLNITVTGKGESDAVSPEKYLTMRAIFDERIDGVNLDNDILSSQRKNRFKSILSKVIERIVRELSSGKAKKKLF